MSNMASNKIMGKIFLDLFILACVAFPLLVLLLWVEPFERGYFEDDMSIRLPYRDQQISIGMLAGIGFAFIIFTIIVVENYRDKHGLGVGEKFVGNTSYPGCLWQTYNTIGIFLFGAACQQLTSDFTKVVVGRLRPHFYDVCGPVPLGRPDPYVEKYRCSVNLGVPALLKDMKLSFPSSHASFSMYCAIFFVFYIQVKCKCRRSKLLRHAAQFVVVLAAWYVGLTRVVDNMHHWSDVAAGFAIGAVYACLVFIYVLKPKKDSPLPTQWEEPPAPTNTLPRVTLAR